MPVVGPAPTTTEIGALAGRAHSGDLDAIRLSNDLVRVTGQMSSGPAFVIEFWDGAEWREKGVDIWHELVPLVPQKVSILDNRPEACTAQFESSLAVGGRATVGVTLRRGSWVAIFQVSTNAISTLRAVPIPNEAMTKTNERQLSDVADAQGHKLMMGAPRTWVQLPATGLMGKGAIRQFTFYVGLQLTGAGAGDTALDLSMQAIGWLSEQVGRQHR